MQHHFRRGQQLCDKSAIKPSFQWVFQDIQYPQIKSIVLPFKSFDIQLSFQKNLLPYTVHTVSRQSSFFPWEDAEYSIDRIFQHIMRIGKACRLLVRECRVAVCKQLPRRPQHFCEKNAAFPWTWCNLYCFKFRESSKCAAFFRNDKHFSGSKRHPFTKISPVTYMYNYIYTHTCIWCTYMHIIHISYLI